MRVHTLKFSDLTARDAAIWNGFAAARGPLSSPYLRFEFAQAVASVRDDVRLLAAEIDGEPIGFLPFHAPRGGVARPLAAPMSDHQGWVCAPGVAVGEREMLSAMGAGAFVYENWSGPAPGRSRARHGSAVMDLCGGFETWRNRREALHRDHFRKTARRLKRAEREHGPARLVVGDPDGALIDTLLAWKSAQYRATGKLDLFAIDWVDALVRACAARSFEAAGFGGLVFSLWFGDRLAAVETGLAADGVYHSWFPAYDPAFAACSPGLQLLEMIAQASPGLGIARIDLGRGAGGYKAYYTDHEIPLTEGRALAAGLAAARVGGGEMAEELARVLPGALSAAPAKLRRRWAQTAAFEPALSRRIALMGEAVASQALGSRAPA
ncbi:GNAT family N-acetyltransferase [Glycocaulis profundi]|nr:GNAT family N-acetyltransferase [Glycocaulis profundi]